MTPIRIDCIVGARPNFIKIAAIMNELATRPGFSPRLIHTGQHYSPEMSDLFFRQLELPDPDINLGVSAGSPTQQTAEMMQAFEPIFGHDKPEVVLVVGDVTSTVATALVAVRLNIRVAHVEAGLRSFDRSMPEEINRIVTDVLSDFLFASEPSGVENLKAEGISSSRVFFTGNVMIDTLLRFRDKAAASQILNHLDLKPKSYAVATLHRPSNVDDPAQLDQLVELMEEISERLPVIFPVHPRTEARLHGTGRKLQRVRVTAPLGYLDFLQLMANARLVLTDSGGIQEETTILQVPCLTLRENTERPSTITSGSNRLVGVSPETIRTAAYDVLDREPRTYPVPELWDGRAAGRILDVLESSLRPATVNVG